MYDRRGLRSTHITVVYCLRVDGCKNCVCRTVSNTTTRLSPVNASKFFIIVSMKSTVPVVGDVCMRREPYDNPQHLRN